MRACFRADYAEILQKKFTGSDDRVHLHGVHVEPREGGGVYLVATNGYKMGIFYDKDGSADESMNLIFGRNVLPAMSPPKGDAVPDRVVHVEDDLMSIQSPDGFTTLLSAPVHVGADGFPDWRRIVPSGEGSAPAVAFNAKYLREFAFGGKWMALSQPDELGICRVQVDEHPEFLGLIMPIHPSSWEIDKGLPEWLV